MDSSYQFAVGDYIRDNDDRTFSPLYGTVTRIVDHFIYYRVDADRSHPHWKERLDDLAKTTPKESLDFVVDKSKIVPDLHAATLREAASYYEAVTAMTER